MSHVQGELEYVVTVKEGVDWQEVHNELTNPTKNNPSVDSNIIPDRVVEVVKLRPNNPRNTHYYLTKEEKDRLVNDPRIVDVKRFAHIGLPKANAFQDGEFNKNSLSSNQHDNWGLLRHISETNAYGASSTDPGGTFDYVLDGTGVDMVIADTGIQADHPEWQDANGVTRLKQIDWYAASGVSGSMPVNFYTDTDGHGTHCAGTMMGRYFGWAKNADIYNITHYGNSQAISTADFIDCLLGWHNAKLGTKPTVVNMSFGYAFYLNTTDNPNRIQFSRGIDSGYYLTGGVYRGVSHTAVERTNLRQYGINGEYQGSYNGKNVYGFPYRVASFDADIRSLTTAGIHVVMAAGNDSMKCDVPGGADWDNYLEFTADNVTIYRWYYHRGGTPSLYEAGSSFTAVPAVTKATGFNVGALGVSTGTLNSTLYEQKATFSQSGPAVDIWTAGQYIISAQPSNMGSVYHYNNLFRQAKYSGTSMAAPQMCGMIGCLLQAHPDWTPEQVYNYFTSNAKPTMYDNGNDADYTNSLTTHGAPNRLAYFPLAAQRPFTITEV